MPLKDDFVPVYDDDNEDEDIVPEELMEDGEESEETAESEEDI